MFSQVSLSPIRKTLISHRLHALPQRLGYKSHLAKLGKPFKAPAFDPSVLWAGERYLPGYDWTDRKEHLKTDIERRRARLANASDDDAESHAGLISSAGPRRKKSTFSSKKAKSSSSRARSRSSSSSEHSSEEGALVHNGRDEASHGDEEP